MRYCLPDTDDALTIRADAEDLAHRLAEDTRDDYVRALYLLHRRPVNDVMDEAVHMEAHAILYNWCDEGEQRAWQLFWRERGAVEALARAVEIRHSMRVAA